MTTGSYVMRTTMCVILSCLYSTHAQGKRVVRVWEWWIFLTIPVFWNVSLCHWVFPLLSKECSLVFWVGSSGPLDCEGEGITILGKRWEPLARQCSGKSQKTWNFSDTTVLALNIAPWMFLLRICWMWQWDIVCTIMATEQTRKLFGLVPDLIVFRTEF
jgi:hypothetical protein